MILIFTKQLLAHFLIQVAEDSNQDPTFLNTVMSNYTNMYVISFQFSIPGSSHPLHRLLPIRQQLITSNNLRKSNYNPGTEPPQTDGRWGGRPHNPNFS